MAHNLETMGRNFYHCWHSDHNDQEGCGSKMSNPLLSAADSGIFKIGLVLFLSFLIGLEREEQKLTSGRYGFGGVRTYPLLGLVGYSVALLSAQQPISVAIGFVAISGLLMLAYWHKVSIAPEAGITSEIAGLAIYLMGALVYHGHYWVASTIVVASLILLELKSVLEGLTQRFSEADILTFTKFLLLTIVILPVLPNQAFSSFQLNPFRTWLVVVAVSTISYISFLLQKVVKGRGGVALVALLGGAYSSTVTTVALAKQSAADCRPYAYAGGVLMASGMMYLRLAVLVGLFNTGLGKRLILPFGLLAIAGIAGGALWARQGRGTGSTCTSQSAPTQNPLELRAAILFALLFVGIVVLTHFVVQYAGSQGVYGLAAILGVTDVDPFTLSMTQTAGQSTSLSVAALAILIAAASNNAVKGLYALGFGDRSMGRQSLGLLLGLGLLGLVPCFLL
jgi:uncharacterized membrane protein (DUF4010 family)